MNKTIYVFSPHPDDEVLACGGVIAKKIQEGFVVKIVVLTSGEKSHASYNNSLLDNLSKIRESESIRSSEILGVQKENITFLRYPDSKINENKINITKDILNILTKDINKTVEIYAPHIYDRHIDHKASNEIVLDVIDKLDYEKDIFLYITWSMLGEFNFTKETQIDIRDTIKLKTRAIAEHKSQISLFVKEQKQPILGKTFLQKKLDTFETFYKLKNNNKILDNETYENLFSQQYKNGKWANQETISGSGSKVSNTISIRQTIQKIIDNNHSSEPLSFCDLGCGDLNWIKEINFKNSLYLGIDIVPEIIQKNIDKYTSRNFNFRIANIVNTTIPKVDYIICKDILTHLTLEDNVKIINSIINSGSQYLIAYSDLSIEKNAIGEPGGWRGLNLEKEPFSFPTPEQYIEEQGNKKYFLIWHISNLKIITITKLLRSMNSGISFQQITTDIKNNINKNLLDIKIISNRNSLVALITTDTKDVYIMKHESEDSNVIYREVLGYKTFKSLVSLPKIIYEKEKYIIKEFTNGIEIDKIEERLKPTVYKLYGEMVKKMHLKPTKYKYCGYVQKENINKLLSFKQWYKGRIFNRLNRLKSNQYFEKLTSYLSMNKNFLNKKKLYIIHNDLEDHNVFYKDSTITFIDLDGLAIYPKEMDLSKVYLDHSKTGLFKYFLEGYGLVDMEFVKYCAVLKMVELLSLNSKSIRIQTILKNRMSTFYEIIEESD